MYVQVCLRDLEKMSEIISEIIVRSITLKKKKRKTRMRKTHCYRVDKSKKNDKVSKKEQI